MTEQKNITVYWDKIKDFITKYEKFILLILVILTVLYIPMKILSYGWTPTDDAKRHVAFATIDAKWSDILVIDEKLGSDHNPGWHAVLKFLHRHCNFDKTDLMCFSVAGLFCLVNLCGIWASPSPVSWCLALLILEIVDSTMRLLYGRPYLFSCAATIILLHIWYTRSEKDKTAWFRKKKAKYAITVISLVLCVWLHGSWYLFLLIPLSFFLAGKTSEALQQTVLVFLATVIGAVISGDFYEFLYFHFIATFQIFSEPTYNWLLATEFASGHQTVLWVIFVVLLAIFCNHKGKLQYRELAEDPIFIMIMLCWLGGIAVWRFWMDWGKMAFLLWTSYRISDLIESFYNLRKVRIKYFLAGFVILATIMSFTNDGDERYSKNNGIIAIDFFSHEVQKELKGWEPQPGGIVYSNDMRVFYSHFYEYPTAPWKYILGFEPAIMLPEDCQTLRNIGYNDGRLPEDYMPWVNKMTSKDRLILSSVPGDFPQLEWKKGNRYFWIGRLKAASDTAEISKP